LHILTAPCYICYPPIGASSKAAELAEDATLTAPERVKLALEEGPAYPWEIAETTGVPLKTVKNVLTELRKQGMVETTGQTEGQSEQVRLSVPRSNVPTYIGMGRGTPTILSPTCTSTSKERRSFERWGCVVCYL
jgi:hypothetical protein